MKSEKPIFKEGDVVTFEYMGKIITTKLTSSFQIEDKWLYKTGFVRFGYGETAFNLREEYIASTNPQLYKKRIGRN